ncbi:hypothetical protein SCWH03_02330 [Streptomyces pacificus]|uniref:Uncharacterized protein n=1 Tax=Streptomyces pacificus TaxID=2705029 RepID=A0A6A0AN56_9ACTN|nr:hypothetical protein SCWH03_02330 [Streptomyces pacificus]
MLTNTPAIPAPDALTPLTCNEIRRLFTTLVVPPVNGVVAHRPRCSAHPRGGSSSAASSPGAGDLRTVGAGARSHAAPRAHLEKCEIRGPGSCVATGGRRPAYPVLLGRRKAAERARKAAGTVPKRCPVPADT